MSRRKGPRTKVVFALLFQQILQILAYYISKLSRFYHIFFTFLPFLKLVHPSQFFGERKWLYYTFTINMNIYIYMWNFIFEGVCIVYSARFTGKMLLWSSKIRIKKKILYVECVNQSVYIVIQKIVDHVNLLYIKIVKTDVRCVGQLL